MDIVQFFVDFILHVDTHLLELITQYGVWIYLILFIVVFCETGLVVTPFLPGDSLLFAAGVLSGTGAMGYLPTMAVFLFAALSGDCVNYLIGRHVGPAIFHRDSRFIKKEYLLTAHAFYERHGGKAIVLARFVPIVRTFAPFVAGIALMHPYVFLFYNATGGLLWVGGLVSAGYFLGNLEFVRLHFNIIVYTIVVVSVLPLVVGAIRARLSGRSDAGEKARAEERARAAFSSEASRSAQAKDAGAQNS